MPSARVMIVSCMSWKFSTLLSEKISFLPPFSSAAPQRGLGGLLLVDAFALGLDLDDIARLGHHRRFGVLAKRRCAKPASSTAHPNTIAHMPHDFARIITRPPDKMT